MEYVIKNERLKNYLYTLGFNFRTVPDQTGTQEEIYLFPNTNSLQEAITFYSKFRQKINIESKNFEVTNLGTQPQ